MDSSVTDSQSAVQSVDQNLEVKQEEIQESISVGERLKCCVPNSPNALVFVLVVVIYLVFAVIHFAQTSDVGMFTTLLPYAGAYVGIPMVTPHLPWGKKGGDDRQD